MSRSLRTSDGGISRGGLLAAGAAAGWLLCVALLPLDFEQILDLAKAIFAGAFLVSMVAGGPARGHWTRQRTLVAALAVLLLADAAVDLRLGDGVPLPLSIGFTVLLFVVVIALMRLPDAEREDIGGPPTGTQRGAPVDGPGAIS